MRLLIVLATLLAFAAGCEWIVPSAQTLCGNMCARRGVRSFEDGYRDHAGDWYPSKCVCETAQPDGGR